MQVIDSLLLLPRVTPRVGSGEALADVLRLLSNSPLSSKEGRRAKSRSFDGGLGGKSLYFWPFSWRGIFGRNAAASMDIGRVWRSTNAGLTALLPFDGSRASMAMWSVAIWSCPWWRCSGRGASWPSSSGRWAYRARS
jgi:hypothetical protein